MLALVSAYNIARRSFTQQPQRNLRVVCLSILLKLPPKLHVWRWRLLPKNITRSTITHVPNGPIRMQERCSMMNSDV